MAGSRVVGLGWIRDGRLGRLGFSILTQKAIFRPENKERCISELGTQSDLSKGP